MLPYLSACCNRFCFACGWGDGDVGFEVLSNGVAVSNQSEASPRPATESKPKKNLKRATSPIIPSPIIRVPYYSILTSTGRGSDIMVPMAIPSFGGMIIAMLTVFVVPVLYCWVEEGKAGWSWICLFTCTEWLLYSEIMMKIYLDSISEWGQHGSDSKNPDSKKWAGSSASS